MTAPHTHLSPDRIYPFDARGVAKRFRHADAVTIEYRRREPAEIAIDSSGARTA